MVGEDDGFFDSGGVLRDWGHSWGGGEGERARAGRGDGVCGGGGGGVVVIVLLGGEGGGVVVCRGLVLGALWTEVEVWEGHEEETAKGGAEEGAVDGLEAAVGWGVDV